MKSRLLIRLELDIKEAAHSIAADCLRCERAGYLARVGDFDEAARELSAIQQRYEFSPEASISAWLSLADALVSHYSDMGPLALDKLKRAYALSAAAGLKPLQALSAAWLAHIDYLRVDASATARHAAEALTISHLDHHSARARAHLVVAQAYHEGGRFDLARPWYDRVRFHVTAEGDDATLSAMMWNMASLRMAALREAQACGSAEVDAGEHALLSADSTAHLDDMLGVRSLRSLQPILRAQICTLLGQTDEALPLFESHLSEALQQGMGAVEGALLADRAWCRLQASQKRAAREDADAASICLDAEGTNTDRAPGHSRLAQVYKALGEVDLAKRQEKLASLAWEGHRVEQAAMVSALNAAFDSVPV
jgi:hypothetical protein